MTRLLTPCYNLFPNTFILIFKKYKNIYKYFQSKNIFRNNAGLKQRVSVLVPGNETKFLQFHILSDVNTKILRTV